MPGFQISRDFGKTWDALAPFAREAHISEPAKFLGPVKMGAPHFVDFGRNMEHSPDGKAYLLGMGAEKTIRSRAPASSRANPASRLKRLRVAPMILTTPI